METLEIVRALADKQNGAFFKATWETNVPLSALGKKANVFIVKRIRAVVRKGISYKAQKSVIEKVNAGTRELTGELPWGNWKAGYDGLIVEHKDKEYVRVYLGPNPSHIEYIVIERKDGKVKEYKLTKEQLAKTGWVTNSYLKPSAEKPDALTITCDNILSIG